MMNITSSPASNPSSDPYHLTSSIMSFVGLDSWDTQTNYTHNQTHPTSTDPTTTNFEHTQPPLALPITTINFPFYPQPPLVEYSTSSFIKMEDGGSTSIGLNLGHRTYFSSADHALAMDRLLAARAHHQHQPPKCQAEGCKADLSGAKHYHRRHKVCELHSKATVVVAGGMQQRFCQQCSRFHVLAEFDESKRSCRKRLADHNRRRRKPQNNNKNNHLSSTTNTSDKTKHTAPRPSRDSSSKSTSTVTTTNSEGLEGNQGDQSKAILIRNGPVLSLGGVRGTQQGLYSYHQQQYFSSSIYNNNSGFYHQILFDPSSNEASQSNGGGSEQHQTNLPHLGQAMFEVDFM